MYVARVRIEVLCKAFFDQFFDDLKLLPFIVDALKEQKASIP
jgi:hypothetical protein